ncbi:MAG: Asp-tRNA(Asn)/Glu-tRNA(Gln) amidotransferase subunit GatB [Clostridia bacterium]|nr:Asp-tRNA(Asn)/Glu-tRNA(Gln) amidotransferase subunit GatB [Clostridia bacterium]MBQ3553354.1 Asp-tRNA(Asn)/Glu-tRNA(Gln) amidotransferase subunit GatB [Clostridia bacterium]
MKYETVIGLEVHAELSTKTKIFCSCKNEFGGEPNTRCCPVCTGMPGTLPVLNKAVVDYAIKAGLATNCSITKYGKQDRKNYFYPDLPKAYQISQFDLPLCQNGYIDIEVDGETRRIGITRIHIEEDAGKLIHDDYGNESMADYNRCGVPLIEIVSEPDMRSPEEARIYLETLKSILEYTEVSDCKMQEGSLRCDVNLSLRPVGQKEFGTRCEMKNVNSFRAAVRAMEYEQKRQAEILDAGGVVEQETRRWDDVKGISTPMRSKEDAQDYRYFPEPDLVPIVVSDEWVEEIRSTIPELPEQRKARYIGEYGLPEYDAFILTSSKKMADFFDGAVADGATPKAVSNWLMGDISKILNDKELEPADIPFTPAQLAKMIALIEKGTISNSAAKKVLDAMFAEPADPEALVEKLGLAQVSDEGAILTMINDVLSQNPQSIADYKAGKDKAMGFLVGQVMRVSKGKANPQMINKLLKEALDKA